MLFGRTTRPIVQGMVDFSENSINPFPAEAGRYFQKIAATVDMLLFHVVCCTLRTVAERKVTACDKLIMAS